MDFKRIAMVSGLAAMVLGLFLLLLLPHFLPVFLEKPLNRFIGESVGLESFYLDIRHIGIAGADFGSVKIGSGLAADSIQLDYSPASLLDGQLDGIKISGMKLRAALDGGKLVFSDFSSLANMPDSGTSPDYDFRIASLPRNIALSHALFYLDMPGQSISIPFGWVAKLEKKSRKLFVRSTLFLTDRPIAINGVVTGNGTLQMVRIKADSFPLDTLSTLFPAIDSLLPGWVMGRDTVLDFAITFNGTKAWDVELNLRQERKKALAPSLNGFKPRIKSPLLKMTASGKGPKGGLNFFFSAEAVDITKDTLQMAASGIDLTGNGTLDFSEQGNGLDLNFITTLESLGIEAGEVIFGLPGLTIPGRLSILKDFKPSIAISPRMEGGFAVSEKYAVSVDNIQFSFPLSLPFDNRHKSGSFAVGTIKCKKKSVASARGSFQQTPSGADLSGTLEIPDPGQLARALSPGMDSGTYDSGTWGLAKSPMTIAFSLTGGLGSDAMVSASLEYNLPKTAISNGTDDKFNLFSDSEARFSVDAASTGRFYYSQNQLDSRITVALTDGRFSLEEKNLEAAGINTQLTLTDPINLKSLPAQLFTIDRLYYNDINISDVTVSYTVESMASLLVEKAGFHWCNGRVTSGAIRLKSDRNQYDLTLYCDRLRLSELLHQLGSFKAEGEGSLNGRIPVSYGNNLLTFENGFLYSTPGQSGTIKIRGAEILTAGIPKNSPQYAQIDLAREALKNYRYEWAKLYFNTMEDTLKVTMAFDGKPENLLPFVYKKEMGGFVRVDASSPGSHFQGIKIDVNLDLPFNRVLKFSKELNSLFN